MSARQYKIAIGTIHADIIGMQPTVKDLLDFVMANKGDKCFQGQDSSTILRYLIECLDNNALYYETDLEGRINGMILARFDHTRKVAFVMENLAMSLERLGRFATKLHKEHPDYNIEAYRHGHPVKINTNKLISKLL